ncbi:YdcF family protein [Antribacter gilvus]|uniref:YdcF family protein n=1 Tax=Antribacter gilvus TaxID=2304675 RepID=UPI000F776AA5|nr:YdcF family protein [Antribacter gilvus]
MPTVMIPGEVRAEVEVLWDYHDLGHEPRPVDVCIGLGGHDLGVAERAAELFHRGYFPRIVFTGANAPTTLDAFPSGEAVGYRDHAVAHGVPAGAVIVEPRARNTSENLEYSRKKLAEEQIEVGSVLLVTRPYQQRRAYATCRMVWPEVEVFCASQRLPLDQYVAYIGDVTRVIDMIVGDTQRLSLYAEKGFIAQPEEEVPDRVLLAFDRLVAAGYTSRLVPEACDTVAV